MNLGIGLGLNRRLFSGGFSPALLFAGSEPGVWLDPSDLTTMFQDTAGTVPVTTAGQTVALALEKSKGLVLGPELVTNGTFDTDISGWTVVNPGVTTTSVSASGVTVTNNGSDGQGVIRQTFASVVGKTYRLQLDITSAGRTRISGAGGFFLTQAIRNGTFSLFAVATGATLTLDVIAFDGAGGVATFDNISVKELPGFHATQATGTFRPAYQITPQRGVYDGSDDRLSSPFLPTLAGSYAVRMNGTTAIRVAMGSQGATDGRAFIGIAADGSIGAGIGTQSTATIKGATDVRNTWVTAAVTWNGTTVKLYENGVEVYSGAQSGAVNTTIPVDLGALNNNGTRAAFFAGSIGAAIAIGRAMTPAEITQLHQYWSAIA